jgi:hypothetical protein
LLPSGKDVSDPSHSPVIYFPGFLPSALKKEKSYIKKKDSLELGEYFPFH